MKSLVMFGLLVVLTAVNTVNGQDKIVKRNGDIITGTVKEIGTSEIKYLQDELKGVVFTIEINQVEKIIFSDGKEYKIDYQKSSRETVEQNSDDLFLIQKKNALKFDFISPIFNTTTVCYERCLKPGASLEFTLGAVGLGLGSTDDKAAGVLFRGGYKFIKSPDFYLKGLRYAHILKGRYVKLEFDFSRYAIHAKYDYYSNYENQSSQVTKWAFLLVLGTQSVFSDSFVIDTYAGIGIGRSHWDRYDFGMPYGLLAGDSEVPIAFSAGIRLGFLFGKPDQK
jgi:hypothetical protein